MKLRGNSIVRARRGRTLSWTISWTVLHARQSRDVSLAKTDELASSSMTGGDYGQDDGSWYGASVV